MSDARISGLASGLDTATIISQLMALEAQPQSRLKSQQSREQANLKTLQDLNAKVAALATQAGALAKPAGWNPVTVTSSSENVTATGTPSAVTGSASFTVGQQARAHQLRFAGTAAMTSVVTSGSTTVRLDLLDGTTKDLDTGDGTLTGLVGALNASGTGVKASTVRLDDGTVRLLVTSATTGAAGDFTLTNLDGSDLLGGATVTAGQNATLTIGGDTVSSPTNTFSGVVSGLDITLKPGAAPGTAVTLDVAADTTTLKGSVTSLVEALNGALTSIDSLTSYNAASRSGGALYGDPGARSVRAALANALYPTDGTSLAGLGLQLDRSGKLVFDEAAFDRAYAADPAAVRAQFTAGPANGFAARVEAVAKQASNATDGVLTSAVKSRTAALNRMADSIEAWDRRLELRRTTLTRQFTALETALGQMQSQSSWLAGQLSSLPASSS